MQARVREIGVSGNARNGGLQRRVGGGKQRPAEQGVVAAGGER